MAAKKAGLRAAVLTGSGKNGVGRCGKAFVRFLNCGMLYYAGRVATSLLYSLRDRYFIDSCKVDLCRIQSETHLAVDVVE